MDSLKVGHGRECITPPLGIKMVGYGKRTEGAAEVHDDLFANAVVLEAGDQKVAVLTCDICNFKTEHAEELKAAIERETGLPPDRVLLNATHSHCGPSLGGPDASDLENDYRADLIHRSLSALRTALDDAAPAALAAGVAPLDIGCNRREKMPDGRTWLGVNPDGPTLHEVTVWRFAREGKPDVVLFSTPMHGTTLGQWNLSLSAEWMGLAVQRLEAEPGGARFVFLQGCGADQNPYTSNEGGRRGTFADVAERADDAAAAVRQALGQLRALSAAPLAVVVRTAELPPKEDDGDPQVLRLHGIRLGDAVVAALNAEVFVEYALFGREVSPAEETLVLGYSNGNIGYLPTADAYPEGGYEIDVTRVGPGSEPIVKDALRELFRDLSP